MLVIQATDVMPKGWWKSLSLADAWTAYLLAFDSQGPCGLVVWILVVSTKSVETWEGIGLLFRVFLVFLSDMSVMSFYVRSMPKSDICDEY